MARKQRTITAADPKAAARMKAFRTNSRQTAAVGAAMAAVFAELSGDDWTPLGNQLEQSRLSVADLQELSAILIGYARHPKGGRVEDQQAEDGSF